ncbi:MAG: VCBS repeat-containing protein [Bacteroidota bacterium]
MKLFQLIISICLLLNYGCKEKTTPLFSLLPPSSTGVRFENTIKDTDTLNILDYLYYYNGGGVGLGDFNNDGLTDIYFTSNQQSNKLYVNKGDFSFEDITEAAGVKGNGNWKTGVTLADVNEDGYLDIYVCEVGGYKNFKGRNELFINNGAAAGSAIKFEECALEYGLAIEGFNTQSAFFDYDRDGDLDMFLVNHSVHSNESYGRATMRNIKDAASGDKLFRNDSTASGRKFIEVTDEAGIFSSTIGYGLNVAIADINNDGWDDIYVSNDFHENDYYYLNNGNGSFSEINQQAFDHESRFSMGSAIADMNNDGWQDIITLDMLPADEKVLKSSSGDDPIDIYNFKLSFGYHHQNARNCLQLNNGNGKKFSEIARYAGIAATDWSWAPLTADFDNDGIKDLFVTNGILRRPNDLDFIKYYSARAGSDTGRAADKRALSIMPEGKVSNYFFKGSDSLKFADMSTPWGFDQPTLSNGAAYADLDNDGDLDLVINNINSPAGIYKNNTVQNLKNNWITVELEGPTQNKFGIGSKVILHQEGKSQYNYQQASKGFESATLQNIHFGTGKDSVIKAIEVYWPDGKTQVVSNIKTNQKIKFAYKNALDKKVNALPYFPGDTTIIFEDITKETGISFTHREDEFTDFNSQPLMPHMASTRGPKMAIGDINGDSLDDMYVCGARMQPGQLFQQTKAGKFISTNQLLFAADSVTEEVNAIFFDADNDKDQDLYIVSGGNRTENEIDNLDRLFINDGKGSFEKSANLPKITGNKSVAAAADIDNDGDLDLFVGGYVVAGSYGIIPSSYLLKNDGRANFSISNDDIAPGLRKIGMVTDAVWNDFDKDGWNDLIIVGEWMPVTIFKNNKGKLINNTTNYGLQQTKGLWTSLHVADINGDGMQDILAGNRGENTRLHATEKAPLKLYVGDIDNNGIIDPLLAIEKNGLYYSFAGKEDLDRQIPSFLRKNYLSYSSYAGQNFHRVFGSKIDSMAVFEATMLSSIMLINNRNSFTVSKLPAMAQWSVVCNFFTADFNGDNKTDILATGNLYGVTPYEGRYDASDGTMMLSNKNGFRTIHASTSGLKADGEVRDIKSIRSVEGKKLVLVATNNEPLQVYSVENGNDEKAKFVER